MYLTFAQRLRISSTSSCFSFRPSTLEQHGTMSLAFSYCECS